MVPSARTVRNACMCVHVLPEFVRKIVRGRVSGMIFRIPSSISAQRAENDIYSTDGRDSEMHTTEKAESNVKHSCY